MEFHVPGREPKWRYRQVPRAAHIPLPHREGLCRIPRLDCIEFIRFAVIYFRACSEDDLVYFQACYEDDLGKGLHPPLAKDACRTGRNRPSAFLLRCVVARASTFPRC